MAGKNRLGYHVPYMVTGALNQHPRAAMLHMESENKSRITEFLTRRQSVATLNRGRDTMGTFMKISGAPQAIEERLKQVAAGNKGS